MSALPPEDAERAEALAQWLEGLADPQVNSSVLGALTRAARRACGVAAREGDRGELLRHVVALLRKPAPPPAAGVSKEGIRAEESGSDFMARFSATLSAVAEVLKAVPGAEGWAADIDRFRLTLPPAVRWRRFPDEAPPEVPRMLLTAQMEEYNPTICYYDGAGTFFADGNDVTNDIYAWDFLPPLPSGPGTIAAVEALPEAASRERRGERNALTAYQGLNEDSALGAIREAFDDLASGTAIGKVAMKLRWTIKALAAEGRRAPAAGLLRQPPPPPAEIRGEHDCEASAPPGFLISGYRQDGERWTCPDCGAVWIHSCDEAEGCRWDRALPEVKR